ncbi:MAG: hypothetical protein H6500_00530 [Candidatus Woesearchaeota archaeon]|nr:hypothetical protein [Nanoarchaeota archaeon]USN44318.1 MAG: hypothetical protein H6500_00530 [Candidatus Woesearchaeota archaeon]
MEKEIDDDLLLKRLLVFLRDNEYIPKDGLFYYPGSGWHDVPLQVFGADKVYHLSKEETKGDPDVLRDPLFKGESAPPSQRKREIFEDGYFSQLRKTGAKYMIEGDYRETQAIFEENKFAATLIWGVPSETIIEALPELCRVTKINGLLILGTDQLYMKEKWNQKEPIKEVLEQRNFPRVSLPEEFSLICVYRNSK